MSRPRIDLVASVATVFRSTIGWASQANSIAADPSILAYGGVVETGRGGSQRVTFSQAESRETAGGGPVSHVRRFIPERLRCPGNYSRDVAENHRDRWE